MKSRPVAIERLKSHIVGFRKHTGETCYRVVYKKDLDEIKEMFHMDIIAEQKIMMRDRFNLWIDREAEVKRLQKRYGNRWLDFFVQGTERYETYLHFSLKLDPHARLFNGIKEMPREINRIIMSFLSVPIKFTLIMFTDTTYPFSPMMWDMKYSTWANFPDGRLSIDSTKRIHWRNLMRCISDQAGVGFGTGRGVGTGVGQLLLCTTPHDVAACSSGRTFFDSVVAKCLFYCVIRENSQFQQNWACGWTPSKMLIVFLMRLKQDLSSLASI